MGFNTTVVIYNDALGYIEKDPVFGRRLVQAITAQFGTHERQDFFAAIAKPDGHIGGTSSAGLVIEQHHADQVVYVAVGRNEGKVVDDPAVSVALVKRNAQNMKKRHDKAVMALRDENTDLPALLASAHAHVPADTQLDSDIWQVLWGIER